MPSSAVVICIDGPAHWPDTDPIRHYVALDSLVMEQGSGAEKAFGMMNYVVDHYYDNILTGIWGDTPGYQFNMAMWELTGDFDGTLASLSTTSGGSYVAPTDPEYTLYTTIVGDLQTHFNDISADYRSTKYNTWIMDDQTDGYQTMLMISPISVPEPSSLLLLLGTVGFIGFRHRRR